MNPHEIGGGSNTDDILREYGLKSINAVTIKLGNLAHEILYLRGRLKAAQLVVDAARGWCETPGNEDTHVAGVCAAVQEYDRQFPWEDA